MELPLRVSDRESDDTELSASGICSSNPRARAKLVIDILLSLASEFFLGSSYADSAAAGCKWFCGGMLKR
jgi:hypothetical protein